MLIFLLYNAQTTKTGLFFFLKPFFVLLFIFPHPLENSMWESLKRDYLAFVYLHLQELGHDGLHVVKEMTYSHRSEDRSTSEAN